MKAIHKKRLLRAADIVEKSDSYDQAQYFNYCGSPACALGHYVVGTKYKVVPKPKHRYLSNRSETKLRNHFGLDFFGYHELFSAFGCGRAQTGKEAAKYIRNFVKRKEAEK